MSRTSRNDSEMPSHRETGFENGSQALRPLPSDDGGIPCRAVAGKDCLSPGTTKWSVVAGFLRMNSHLGGGFRRSHRDSSIRKTLSGTSMRSDNENHSSSGRCRVGVCDDILVCPYVRTSNFLWSHDKIL